MLTEEVDAKLITRDGSTAGGGGGHHLGSGGWDL